MAGMGPGMMHGGMASGALGGPAATLRPGTMRGAPAGAPPTAVGRAPTVQGGRMTANRTRQGTATQQPVLGVGALTEVQVSGRPMTAQGMAGMKTGSLGPKRQVYDKTYYMQLLRKKSQELVDEVASLNKEINEIQQDNQLYMNLEKRYDSLVSTVRSLEGDLADHNLATDKQRTDTRPEEVQHMFAIMKSQNEQQRRDVDEIFLEKRNHEEDIARIDQEIASIARAAEDRLNELHPDQRREYEDLREENGKLGQDLFEAREELDHISGRLNSLEAKLRTDMLRTRFQELNTVRHELDERLDSLQQEVKQCSMSIPEQRDLLLAKVKNHNAEIVAAEKSNSELKLEVEKLRAAIREVTENTLEKKEEGNDQQKYEILFTKDKEMTQFINSFNDHKAEEEKKLKEKQDAITELLQRISKSLALPSDVTPETHLRDMEDELDFKSKQLHNSEATQNRLEAELTKREGELEKIDSLDLKISIELQQVEAKMQQYEQDVSDKYDLVDDMCRRGEARLKGLESRKSFLEIRLSALKQQVGFLKLRSEGKRQELADDGAAAGLEQQEQKMRQFAQTLYALQSFITQKSSESDYRSQMGGCLEMAGSINKILQEQTQRPMPMA